MAPVRRGGSLVIASTVTMPAGIQTGDVGIIVSFSPTGSSKVGATGWTELASIVGQLRVLTVLTRSMSSADSGAVVTINNHVDPIPVAAEVWGGAVNPSATLKTAVTNGVIGPATAVTGSVPLYVWEGYDETSNPQAPSSITPPSGWAGTYLRSNAGYHGMGLWFTNPITGTSAPGGTLVGPLSGHGAETAVIILPPAVTNNAYIAGSTSAGDVLCSVVLAGSTAAQDVNLVWTP